MLAKPGHNIVLNRHQAPWFSRSDQTDIESYFDMPHGDVSVGQRGTASPAP
jgi:hypothetical protein